MPPLGQCRMAGGSSECLPSASAAWQEAAANASLCQCRLAGGSSECLPSASAAWQEAAVNASPHTLLRLSIFESYSALI